MRTLSGLFVVLAILASAASAVSALPSAIDAELALPPQLGPALQLTPTPGPPPVMPGSANPPAADSVQVLAVQGLNIRGGPGTQYPIVARARYAGYFAILAETEGWFEIRFQGGEGWVSGDYVQLAADQGGLLTCDAVFLAAVQDEWDASDGALDILLPDLLLVYLVPAGMDPAMIQVMPDWLRTAPNGPSHTERLTSFDTPEADAWAIRFGLRGAIQGWPDLVNLVYRMQARECPVIERQDEE